MDPLLQACVDADLEVVAAQKLTAQRLYTRRKAFKAAVDAGVSTAEISLATGLVRQRVYKILDNNRRPQRRPLKVVDL